ncbi:hypothetical protein T10_4413 [Trichinella papuae]|uniref:Uncharacterized protein n=1 Tax=Trichinella papuae TaxID=268474 RepID=A0A0V1M7Z8_9BILA|nr:hypothetical protein T10_4413 [Trichinella papuae]
MRMHRGYNFAIQLLLLYFTMKRSDFVLTLNIGKAMVGAYNRRRHLSRVDDTEHLATCYFCCQLSSLKCDQPPIRESNEKQLIY